MEIDFNKSKVKEEIEEEKNEIENKLKILEKKRDLILTSIFFKKYKVIKQIGQGSFSNIYEGENIKTGEKVGIKIEQKNKNKNEFLHRESCFLYSLKDCVGIPKIISFGETKYYNILIEPLLGENLYNLFIQNKNNFTLKDICLIALQCINRLESIHSKGIIHCDIKPENFIVGRKDKRIIYLIDFGLSKKYRSDKTKNHITFSITKTLTGTARYASMNALSGIQLSRRDDLESLSYIILYFLTKKLPWQGITGNTLAGRYKKIYFKKLELEKWEKFKMLPIQIQNFIRYCRNLKFKQDPDYRIMKKYFYELMEEYEIKDDADFSWITDKSIIGSKLPGKKKRKKCYSVNLLKRITKSVNCFDYVEDNIKNVKNKSINKNIYFSTNDIKNNIDEKNNNNIGSVIAKYEDDLEEYNNDKKELEININNS